VSEENGADGTENTVNSDTTNQTQTSENLNETGEQKPVMSEAEELALLKGRAKLLGIQHSGNIGLAALKEKIAAKMAEGDAGDNSGVAPVPDAITVAIPAPTAAPTITPAPAPAVAASAPLTAAQEKAQLRRKMLREESALIRLRITNLNPQKKDLPGEIFTVANELIGTFRKFIPYGEASENGYHVPMFIYRQLKDRKFLHIRTVKDKRTGTPRVITSWQREFALEELPPLTEEELKDLATAQAAAGSVSSSDEEM
jgi:hypothetical protein